MSFKQRESPIFAELCSLVVSDLYGDLASRVFGLLARHGRQTLASLVRNSTFNGRQIKNGLVILIQQSLVFHATNPKDDREVFYQVDWQQAYDIIRNGRMVQMVEDRFGAKEATIISNLLSLGHARVGDLTEGYFPSYKTVDTADFKKDAGKGEAGLTNGHTKSHSQINGHGKRSAPSELDDADAKPTVVNGEVHTNGAVNGASSTKMNGVTEAPQNQIKDVEELHQLLFKLMKDGWVGQVDEVLFLSPHDRHELAEREIVARDYYGKYPAKLKEQTMLAAQTLKRKRDIRDILTAQPERQIYKGSGGQPNKRRKVNGHDGVVTHSGSGAIDLRDGCLLLDNDLVVHVNQEKLSVAMRTERLYSFAETRTCSNTAKVYHTLLRLLEPHVKRCYEEWPDPFIQEGRQANGASPPSDMRTNIPAEELAAATEVAARIQKFTPDLDLTEGLDPEVVVEILRGNYHIASDNSIKPAVYMSNLTQAERNNLVHEHLQVLYKHDFVTWNSRRGISEWWVDYDRLTKSLIQQEIENTVMARKGKLGIKLIRALRKKGRLDEREACTAMMMNPQQIRSLVAQMCAWGFVQIQEVPKTDARMTKLSWHLVWYDRQRARERLLHDTYKGMARIMQRLKYEHGKVQPTIDKAERSDVVGNEEKYLAPHELEALKEWQRVEEKLLVQLGREDELVAVLRDFIGPLPN